MAQNTGIAHIEMTQNQNFSIVFITEIGVVQGSKCPLFCVDTPVSTGSRAHQSTETALLKET